MAVQKMYISKIDWVDGVHFRVEYNTDKTLKKWETEAGAGTKGYDVNFFYENGRLVKMVDSTNVGLAEKGTIIYGANDLPLKVCEYGNWQIYDSLEYNAKKQLITYCYINKNHPEYIDATYKYTWEGNNVVRQDAIFVGTRPGSPVPEIGTYSYRYKYDDKKNYFTSWEALMFKFSQRPYYMSANNMVEEIDESDGSSIYIFEYNDKGYPTKAWFTHRGQGVMQDSARIEYLQP